jgi:hypothetical protein
VEAVFDTKGLTETNIISVSELLEQDKEKATGQTSGRPSFLWFYSPPSVSQLHKPTFPEQTHRKCKKAHTAEQYFW